MEKIFSKAKWIWEKQNTKDNDWVLFKTEFETEAKGEFVLNVSCDTRYFLYVNQKIAVLDGCLLRDAYEKNSGFYDEVDISRFVKAGKNKLEILVWHWGNGGRNNNPLGFAGLIFECKKLNLFSSSSTLCARHTAYLEESGERPSYLYGGFNIHYDARQEKLNFANATEFDGAVFGKLEKRPIPLFYFSPIKKGKYEFDGEKYVLSLPTALHVMPCFEVEAKGGEKIEIRHDRFYVKGGPGDHHNTSFACHRTEYFCKKGKNQFLSLDWMPCEKLHFYIPKGIKINWLGYRISQYDTKIKKLPKTGDRLLDILLKKCARTLIFCMRDNFMDCPDRERGQWIGDISVQTPQVFYALDESAVLLLKKAIKNFIGLRNGDILRGNIPGTSCCELPAQSLHAISEYGMISEYYRFTKDKEILKLCFEPMINYLKLWKMDADGLVEIRIGDQLWTDHLVNNDERISTNCWYYLALKFAKFCAKEISDKRFDDFLTGRIGSIKENFEKQFWKPYTHFAWSNGYSFRSGDYIDDRANALCVLCGFVDDKKAIFVKDTLLTVFNASTYMEGYVIEALCKLGYKHEAYLRMMARYYPLIVNENATMWEDFYLLGTKNHAWTGAPLTLYFKYFKEN